jgi:hypothetical protein
MSSSYSKWSDIKAKGRALDSRTSEEQAAGKAAAREHREAAHPGPPGLAPACPQPWRQRPAHAGDLQR